VVRQTQAALDAGLIAQAQADAAFLRAEALTRSLSRSAIDTAESTANAAAQDVVRLTALLEQARLQLDRFAVTAPITGTVLSIDTEPGQLVDPTAAFMTLADLGSLVVETDIDETYATRIAKGMPVLIQLAGAARTRPGHVTAVSSQVDATTGGLAIKVAFDDPVAAPVGLTATMNIVVETLDAAISVPRAALVETSQGRSLFVVAAGLARKTAVTVIEWPAERLLVTAGLHAGDVIITEAAGVTDGAAVKVTTPPKGP
jgi:RND family efflux transporter MFP subunit